MAMTYAGKGTIRRAPTLEQYKNILDDLYARHGDNPPENNFALPLNSQTHVKPMVNDNTFAENETRASDKRVE